MAYITKRKSGNKLKYCIIWYDFSKSRNTRKARKQVFCEREGAKNDYDRQRLLAKYKDKEESSRRSTFIDSNEVTTNVFELLKEYLKEREEEAQIRKIRGGRHGISESTLRLTQYDLHKFSKFLAEKGIESSLSLTQQDMKDYKTWLQSYRSEVNDKFLSTASINKCLRTVKTFINNYKHIHPPLFTRPEGLIAHLSQFRNDEDMVYHFKPAELKLIVEKAYERDHQMCKITRESKRQGKKFSAEMPLKFTPILPTILLIMLTGMRKSEALNLKWKDIDLDNGTIIVKAQKTGKTRLIPLADEVHGKISPTFVKILRKWHMQRESEYVLPIPERSIKPTDLKKPLEKFRQDIEMPDLTFQNLRKNFVSYVVSYGIPPAIAAFWAGHSPAVAEKHYLSYVFGNIKASSLDTAMNILKVLKII